MQNKSRNKALSSCHAELVSASRCDNGKKLKQVQGDSIREGFTLIELLVVVLIIGILAAVALPQYQKAVDKARAAEVVQIIGSLRKAVDLWIMENPGQNASMLYEDSTDELSIELPCQYSEGDCLVNKNVFRVDIGSSGFASVYSYLDLKTYDFVTIAAVRDVNGTWTYKCGYGGSRERAICKGLHGYEAIEGFDI